MTNTARIEKVKSDFLDLDYPFSVADWNKIKKSIQDNIPKQISVEAVEKLSEKYKPFIISFDKVWNSLASWIVEEFINDLDILLSQQQQDETN